MNGYSLMSDTFAVVIGALMVTFKFIFLRSTKINGGNSELQGKRPIPDTMRLRVISPKNELWHSAWGTSAQKHAKPNEREWQEYMRENFSAIEVLFGNNWPFVVINNAIRLPVARASFCLMIFTGTGSYACDGRINGTEIDSMAVTGFYGAPFVFLQPHG